MRLLPAFLPNNPLLGRLVHTVQATCVPLLYLLTVLVLANAHEPWRQLPAIGIGFALNALPLALLWILHVHTSLCVSPKNRYNLAIFSTYGGGNRGLLLATLLFTQVPSTFFMMDLGNFLALVTVYPLLAAALLGEQQAATDQRKLLKKLILPTGILAGGLVLNLALSTQWQESFVKPAADVTKTVMSLLIWLYLGMSVLKNGLSLDGTFFTRMAVVRIAITLPLVAVFGGILTLLGATVPWALVLMFLVLPVSSLAAAFVPAKYASFVTEDTLMSAGAFTLLLLVAKVAITLLPL